MSIQTADWLGRKVGEGRFLIIRSLRDGGMAHVFFGQDMTTGDSVIIKAPKVEQVALDANFRQRFMREIQALKKLAHPNVVRILCNGEEEGLPFVVLRFLNGGTLGDRMYTRPDGSPEPQPAESLRTWLPMLAEALDFIHAKGYVHRDVKPHNILFDGTGKPFLGDLGIARVLPSNSPNCQVTRISEWPVGTPPYMAPEQIVGQSVGPHTDQFALAVVVYEWLSARRPYSGDTPDEVLGHQRQPPPPLFLALPKLPMVVSKAVTRALARKPEDRFATCKEFASEVINGLDSSPAATAPPRKPAASNVTAVDIDPRLTGAPTPGRTNPASNPDTWSVHVPETDGSSMKPAGNPAAEAAAVLSPSRDRPKPVAPAPMPNREQPRPAAVAAVPTREHPRPATVAPVPNREQPRPAAAAPIRELPKAVGSVSAVNRDPATLPPRATAVKKTIVDDPFLVPDGDFIITPDTEIDPKVRGGKATVPGNTNSPVTRLMWCAIGLAIIVTVALAGKILLPEMRLPEWLGGSAATQSEEEESNGKTEPADKNKPAEFGAKVKALEQEKADLAVKLASAEQQIKTSQELLMLARMEVSEARNQLTDLEKKLKSELARRKMLEEAQAEAVRRASRAEEEAKAAQDMASAANISLTKVRAEFKDLRKKLSVAEETAQKAKLWFVLRNTTGSTVEFATRCQLWNGQWTEWQERTIKKQEQISISSEPGSIAIVVRYVPAPGEVTDEKEVHAQIFPAAKKQTVKNIDCSYVFQVSKDGKGIEFKWK